MSVDQPVRFMIACPARTGSTMLVHLLRSHPDCVSHSEVLAFTDGLGGFDPKVKDRLAVRGTTEDLVAWRRKDPAAFLNEVGFDAGGAACVGVKIKSDELVQRSYRRLLDELRRSVDIKVLHLNRSNLLERYLSWVMVNKVTGVTMAVDRSGVPEFEPVRINPKKAEKDFVEAERRADTMREWFRDHDLLEVDYETIVRDPDTESARMCAFLGLEPVPLTTPTLKITPHVSELIANYDEVERYFAGTRFERLFAPPEADAPVELQRRAPTPSAPAGSGKADRPPSRWTGRSSWWHHLEAIADVPDPARCRILGVDATADLTPDLVDSLADYVGLEHDLDVAAWYRSVGGDAITVRHRGRDLSVVEQVEPRDLIVIGSPPAAGDRSPDRDLLMQCRQCAGRDARLVIEAGEAGLDEQALRAELAATGWEPVKRVEARCGLGTHHIARPR